MEKLKKLLLVITTMTLMGCQTVHSNSATEQAIAKETQPVNLLTAHAWQLVSLNGKQAAKGTGGKSAYISFSPDSTKLSGFTGCNNFFTQYSTDEQTLVIGQLAMTRKYCQQSAALESEFANSLPKAKLFTITEGKLVLMSDNQQVLATFTKS